MYKSNFNNLKSCYGKGNLNRKLYMDCFDWMFNKYIAVVLNNQTTTACICIYIDVYVATYIHTAI